MGGFSVRFELFRLSLWLLPKVCFGEVRSGETIYLQAHTGRRLDVDGSVVEARWSNRVQEQELTIEGTRDGAICSGETIFVRTRDGKYLDVDGEVVEARWGSRGLWQALVIEGTANKGVIRSGDAVFLRTHTGNYIDVEGFEVRARWPDQGTWQTFFVHDKDEEGGTEDLFHGALDIIGAGCGFVNLPLKEEDQRLDVACHVPMETDCTSEARLARACPTACPYVAPHPQLSCVFQCTVAARCSAANPEVAFANNVTHVCESCEVVGCRRCTSRHTCAECFDNFWLEFGGRACMYVWDERAQHGVHAAAALALALALFVTILLVIADHCACCGHCLPQEMPEEGLDFEDSDDDSPQDFGHPPCLEESATSRAIRQGKRHRGRCKVKDFFSAEGSDAGAGGGAQQEPQTATASLWQQAAGPQQIPVCADLRAKFLTGVGLPLFHQWYRFLFLYSALMTAGTFWVYRYSELDGVLQKTGMDHASDVLHGQDAMALCGLRARNSDQLGDSVRAFAHRAAVVYFVLWLLGFCLSVAHAARQKKVAAAFYRQHPCLAEFALNVEGFPPDATDEMRIRNFLREALSTDMLEVSVCYDYRHRRGRVHELLEKVLVHADVQAGTYDSSLAAPLVRGRRSLGLSQEERSEIRSWMKPAAVGGLRNAGHVFAVFPHNYDLQLCRQKFEAESGSQVRRRRPIAPSLPHQDTPRWLPPDTRPLIWVGSDGKMHELVIRDVVCEPPDVVWENLGTEVPRLVMGHIAAGLVIVISFIAMATGIFVPLASYSINYMVQAGSLPTGVMMTVLGTLVMAANWVMCFVHSSVSSFVGFARRDREGLLLFKVFAVLCLLNFLFNVSIALFPESQAHALEYVLHPLGRGLVTMQGSAFQARISAHFFHVLVPGGLFIGYLIWPLQGFLWPFASTLAYLRCRYRRARFVPARAAELALEPLGISIPHDYMGHIVQPTSCTLVLFFASDVAWQTFACLLVWSSFMIPFMRYLHLRQVRRCYFTTNRLDADVLFMWGFPLSMVLAASCFWAAQLYGWPLYLVPSAWAGGIALYVLVLAHWVRPLIPPKSEGHACHRPSYDEVRALRRYDWHNCNPIKVLLSQCGGDMAEAMIPFEVGKEYLQAVETRQLVRRKLKLVPVQAADETRFVDGESNSSNSTWRFFPNVPEVEALINAPLDVIGALSSGVHHHESHSQYASVSSSPRAWETDQRWPVDGEGPQSCPMTHGALGWPSGFKPL